MCNLKDNIKSEKIKSHYHLHFLTYSPNQSCYKYTYIRLKQTRTITNHCNKLKKPTQTYNTNVLYYNFGGQKSIMSFTGLKSVFLGALGINLCPCLFQLLGVTYIPWLMVPSFILKTSCIASSVSL